ncbi:MAG: hypothetical protein R3C26_14230 [Calditrichia bacterium]
MKRCGVFLAGLWLIEYLLVRFILPSPVSIADDLQTGVFSNSFQILFLVLLELTLALLILVNTTGKGWVLIWLLLLRFPIASMLDSESYFSEHRFSGDFSAHFPETNQLAGSAKSN